MDIGDETLPVWNCLSCNFVKWKPFLKLETRSCFKKSKLGKLEIVWKKSEKVLVLQVYGSFEGFSLSALFRLVSYCMTLLQWTGLLLFLVYYVFATIGVQLFGGQIYDGHPALKGSGFAEGDLVAGKQHLHGLGHA